MPVSPLLLAILDQAKEPLHCLHGAGYFTPDEWVKLDLIMNKEYVWTKGPSSTSTRASINEQIHFEHETPTFLPGRGNKDISSIDGISLCASIEPTISDINISPASADYQWKYPYGIISAKPFEPMLPYQKDARSPMYAREQRPPMEYTNTQGDVLEELNAPLKDKMPGYSISIGDSGDKSSLLSSAHKMKTISDWTSDVRNNHSPNSGSLDISSAHQATFASSSSSSSSQGKKKPPNAPKSQNIDARSRARQGDVNMFETSNAAEWEENASRSVDRESPRSQEDLANLINDKFSKIGNLMVQEGQTKKNLYRTNSSSSSSPFPPRMATRNASRALDFQRLARHKESKDRKVPKENETGSQQKTRVCWFWAESPGGCRYKPDECLNLHVKPSANSLLRQSLRDNKLRRGANGSSNTSFGNKPLTCWSWASTGSCGKGDNCKDVHGWVVGGVAPGPKKEANGMKVNEKPVSDQRKKEVIAAATAAGARVAAVINQGNQDIKTMQLVDLRIDEPEPYSAAPSQTAATFLAFNSPLIDSPIHA